MSTPKITKNTIWLNADQLFKLFHHYPSMNAMYKAIRAGTFPVKTFKVGKRLYADKHAVTEYFLARRREAMAALKETT